jgi:putative hydrolase of the HAD superfamily
VVLTNGWDRHARRDAATHFGFDWDEFQDRHDLAFPAFDAGNTSLDEYLNRTLFYRHRDFTREQFVDFMYAQSKEYPESRAVLRAVVRSGKYFVGAINNEPLELNRYRIDTFDLRADFRVFFSSCYVHSRKPEELIFRFALAVTQHDPARCLFIDDRPLNLESPRRLGMHAIHYQNAAQLRDELKSYGVEV